MFTKGCETPGGTTAALDCSVAALVLLVGTEMEAFSAVALSGGEDGDRVFMGRTGAV